MPQITQVEVPDTLHEEKEFPDDTDDSGTGSDSDEEDDEDLNNNDDLEEDDCDIDDYDEEEDLDEENLDEASGNNRVRRHKSSTHKNNYQFDYNGVAIRGSRTNCKGHWSKEEVSLAFIASSSSCNLMKN